MAAVQPCLKFPAALRVLRFFQNTLPFHVPSDRESIAQHKCDKLSDVRCIKNAEDTLARANPRTRCRLKMERRLQAAAVVWVRVYAISVFLLPVFVTRGCAADLSGVAALRMVPIPFRWRITMSG